MSDEISLAEAAVRRARYEVQLERDYKPEKYDDARFERMVRYVSENIINRGEDWREWAAAVEEPAQ